MNQPTRHTVRFLWVGLALTCALLVLAFLLAGLKSRQRTGKPLEVYGQVSPFTLTNQDNQAVTIAELQGKVWVADIIFTRCPGPCLKMTRQMLELQAALPPSSNARLVSLTTDPQYDSPPVLKAYAQRFGTDPKRWMFLTGTPKAIANLAIDSLKLTAIEKPSDQRDSPADLFVHSTIFVVVDKHARLRGIFETTGEGVDPKAVKLDILKAVRQLEREA
ncbi:MAG TPA: SCO family protein [Patescibacteria group bacterium]|nr:SCO family protein [Patescibacteria group bacterium]